MLSDDTKNWLFLIALVLSPFACYLYWRLWMTTTVPWISFMAAGASFEVGSFFVLACLACAYSGWAEWVERKMKDET